jgi:UDP-2-acetamido-3-amino-2,3-dideoxy-glucuronate N-acetyltransferase
MGSHKNLILGEHSNLGKDILFGYNNIFLDYVTIGDGCLIGNNVVIHEGTIIGKNVRIDDNAIIGKLPMKALNSATTKDQALQPPKIGDNCIIGTGSIIYCGAEIGPNVLIADQATVRENVKIGEGTIIGRGVAIENFCTVGAYCKLETNVYLTAYSTLEDRCFIAPCVATSNDNYVGRTKERFQHFKGVTVKKGGRIGANATILPGKTIGEDALIAAGSVVTKDIPGKKIYCGIPAKEFKDVPTNQLLENQ